MTAGTAIAFQPGAAGGSARASSRASEMMCPNLIRLAAGQLARVCPRGRCQLVTRFEPLRVLPLVGLVITPGCGPLVSSI